MPIIVREMKQKILGGLVEELNLELCQKMDEPKRKKKSRLRETLHAKEWSESQALKQNSHGTSSTTVRLWSRVEDDKKNLRSGQGWH